MAIPRVFVSSTYYDLKHMRSSLEKFIESLGFEAILSEKGSIAYSPERPLDESCYKEAEASDILVLIMGGRYGSPSSSENKRPEKKFFERYDSITKKEFEAAVAADVPIFIAVDRAVHVEYETFLKNKASETVQYAHVQNVNVFVLLESILNMPKNNPVFTFDKPSEVEDWLRLQWAGLFGEMLRTRTEHSQLASLASQVANLSEVNKTLKVYLEEVVSKVSKDKAAEIISSEDSRLKAAREQLAFRRNPFVRYCEREFGVSSERISELLDKHRDVKAFLRSVASEAGDTGNGPRIKKWQHDLPRNVHGDIEAARASLGLPYDAELAQARAAREIFHERLIDVDAIPAVHTQPTTAPVAHIQRPPIDARKRKKKK